MRIAIATDVIMTSCYSIPGYVPPNKKGRCRPIIKRMEAFESQAFDRILGMEERGGAGIGLQGVEAASTVVLKKVFILL